MCKISPSFINQQLYKMTSIYEYLIRKSSWKNGLKCFMKVAFMRLIHLNITQGLLTNACWNLDCVEAKIFFNLCIDWRLAEVVDPFFFGCVSTNGTNVFQRSNIQTCVFLGFRVDKIITSENKKRDCLTETSINMLFVLEFQDLDLIVFANLNWISKKELSKW